MSEGEVVYTTETRHPVVSVTTYDEQTHCELDHNGGVCGRRLTAIRRACPIHGQGVPVTYRYTEDRTEDLWPTIIRRYEDLDPGGIEDFKDAMRGAR